tara:strand:- start:2675 stop:3034 length:360 start_codon:yes stop_codon:yes gene_type:complete
MSLTAQEILGADDLAVEEVKTPEWGANVFIRQMQGKELGVFSKLLKGGKEVQEFPIRAIAVICALTLCDKDGKRLFPDHVKGADALEQKSAKVLQRIFSQSMVLSALSTDDEEDTPKKS